MAGWRWLMLVDDDGEWHGTHSKLRTLSWEVDLTEMEKKKLAAREKQHTTKEPTSPP
jgi:hypothetical protein